MRRALGWWRSEYSNSGHTPDSGPTADVDCLWRYDAGYFIPGTPVVADALVHVATQTPHLTRSNLHGIDVESGTLRYSAPADDPATELRGSPTVVDDIAYVTVMDDTPLVRGYDTDTGNRVRGFDVDTLAAHGIPPIVDGDWLFAVTDWTVTSVDVHTGNEHWTFAPVESFYGAPALVDERLFVGSAGRDTDGEPIDTGSEEWPYARRERPWVRALNARTGAVEWKRALEVVPRTVTVVDGMVFCAGSEPYSRFQTFESPVGLSDGGLPRCAKVHAVSVDGEMKWTADLDASIRSAPAAADGTVVIGTREGEGEDAGMLVAFDAVTGGRLWTREGAGGWTAATIADEAIYAGNAAGYVEACSLEDGRPLWRFETDEGIHGPPSVAGGRLYVGDAAGTVYALHERG